MQFGRSGLPFDVVVESILSSVTMKDDNVSLDAATTHSDIFGPRGLIRPEMAWYGIVISVISIIQCHRFVLSS